MVPPKRFGFLATWSKVFTSRLKQQVVHHALVDERNARERLRHCADDVDVANREQLLLARCYPRVPCRGQTLGAMSIATAVVREGRLRTLLAAIAMPAERRGATLGDRSEHTPMLSRHPRGMGLQESVAMSAHNVGHLEGWPRHRLWSRRVRRTVSTPETGIASSGLATACRCRCDRCR